MKVNLKVLGLALVAVMAMSGLAAAAAQAESPTLVLTASTGTVKGGSNDNVLTVQGGSTKCVENGGVKGSRYEATVTSEKSTEVTVKAAFGNGTKGCTAFGVASTVNMKSCHQVWKMVKASNPATATVDIVCTTAGDAITITASSLPCTITIAPQSGLQHIVLKKSGESEPTDVTVEFTTEKTKYTMTGVGCAKAGTFEEGKI